MSRGRARVATARREPARRSKVTLRPATLADCRRVWRWRNDEATRRASFDSALIPYDAHELWFRQSLARLDRRLYVVQVKGQGVGVTRLDVDGQTGTVSIHLAAEWRGRGVGPEALRTLEKIALDLGILRLSASVKAENAASLRAFRKVDFAGAVGGPVVTLVKVLGGD